MQLSKEETFLERSDYQVFVNVHCGTLFFNATKIVHHHFNIFMPRVLSRASYRDHFVWCFCHTLVVVTLYSQSYFIKDFPLTFQDIVIFDTNV